MGDGNANVTVWVDENLMLQSDKAVLTFYAGTTSATTTVNRAGVMPLITISPTNEQNLTSDGGNVRVIITSNTDWTVTSDKDWAVPNKKSGNGNNDVEVSVAKNETLVADRAVITFTAAGVSCALNISRAAAVAYMTISAESEIDVTAEGRTFDITVTSNAEWTVEANEKWITTNVNQGNGNGTVSVMVAATSSVFEENGTLTFTSGSIERKVTIIRRGALPLISLDVLDKIVSSDSGEFNLTITTNDAAWQADGIPKWITLSQNSGVGSSIVKLSYTTNKYQAERNADVVFSAGQKKCILSIVQKASKLPDFENDNEW